MYSFLAAKYWSETNQSFGN